MFGCYLGPVGTQGWRYQIRDGMGQHGRDGALTYLLGLRVERSWVVAKVGEGKRA
jgi:hypothetical protein